MYSDMHVLAYCQWHAHAWVLTRILLTDRKKERVWLYSYIVHVGVLLKSLFLFLVQGGRSPSAHWRFLWRTCSVGSRFSQVGQERQWQGVYPLNWKGGGGRLTPEADTSFRPVEMFRMYSLWPYIRVPVHWSCCRELISSRYELSGTK